MKIQIKNRYNNDLIFETDAETISAAVKAAIAAKVSLSRADLSGANLSGADLEKIRQSTTILPDGDLIGWKKLQGDMICKLRIPTESKRVGGTTGRKCRCEFALVLEGQGKGKYTGLEYKPGEKVVADKFDDNPLIECSHGIHFFISRLEAEEYD